MRMVARKPVSSRTVTQELMIENQWICTGHEQSWARGHSPSTFVPEMPNNQFTRMTADVCQAEACLVLSEGGPP